MPRKRGLIVQCDDCGGEAVRNLHTNRPNLCTDCAIGRVASAAEQLRSKSGPAYERWLASNGPAGTRPPGTD